jgi:hypothetical protein
MPEQPKTDKPMHYAYEQAMLDYQCLRKLALCRAFGLRTSQSLGCAMAATFPSEIA